MKDEVIQLDVGNDEVIYSSFGFDTVEFSKNDGDAQKKIKQKLLECMDETINQFKDIQSNSENHNTKPSNNFKKLEILYRTDTGDGEYIVTDIQSSPTLIDFAIQFGLKVKKLNKENKENSLIPQLKIRMALHSDIGYRLGDRIQGPVLNNLERILSMGSAGDFLLSEYTVAIIKSISKKYN